LKVFGRVAHVDMSLFKFVIRVKRVQSWLFSFIHTFQRGSVYQARFKWSCQHTILLHSRLSACGGIKPCESSKNAISCQKFWANACAREPRICVGRAQLLYSLVSNNHYFWMGKVKLETFARLFPACVVRWPWAWTSVPHARFSYIIKKPTDSPVTINWVNLAFALSTLRQICQKFPRTPGVGDFFRKPVRNRFHKQGRRENRLELSTVFITRLCEFRAPCSLCPALFCACCQIKWRLVYAAWMRSRRPFCFAGGQEVI